MQLGQAVTRGLPAGARARLRQARSKAIRWSMLWAEELPQQFQSGISTSRMPKRAQDSINDWLFSFAVVASEQPGK